MMKVSCKQSLVVSSCQDHQQIRMLNGETLKGTKNLSSLGREPWSSGYMRRLMFLQSWVRIPVLYTRWTFFTLICCKIVLMFVWKRPKINEKEPGMAHFKKNFLHSGTQYLPKTDIFPVLLPLKCSMHFYFYLLTIGSIEIEVYT